MSFLSKPLLTCVLKSLYFEDLLEARLACKQWNVIAEPLLVRVKDDYSLTLEERRNFGKYICEARCDDDHLKTLDSLKNLFPNLKYLCIGRLPEEAGAELFFERLRYFSDAGGLISLENTHNLPVEFIGDLKFNAITLDFLCDDLHHLATLNQPHTEQMSLFYNRGSETELDDILPLASQKFPNLKIIKLIIAGHGRNMANIVSSFKSLKKLDLSLIEHETISPNVQLDTCINHLNLGGETYQFLQDKFTDFCLKGVKQLSLIANQRICPRVELMFPGIEVLTFQQSRYHCSNGLPETFYIFGPISVQSLNMKLESYNLKCNYQFKWPTVLRISLECRSLSVFKYALNWIITCFPSIEAITLKIPEYFFQNISSFQFLKKRNCLSLRCIYSNTRMSFDFIKLLKEGAPKLSLVACPMDPETKLKVSDLGVAPESVPGNSFSK